jgi:hypothetical protein
MTDIDSDYSLLLPIRNVVFPAFDGNQKRAASAIVACVLQSRAARHINCVMELGCGTAEILDSVHTQLVSACGREMKCVGVDCCAAEIAIARELRPEYDFFEQRAEAFMKFVARGGSGIAPKSTLLMCVGHTMSHFHDTSRFLDDLTAWGPGLVLIDFYEEWDAVVRHFESPDMPPVRQLKQSYRSAGGTLMTHTLTTKRNPDDRDRVVRGIETSSDGQADPTGFWTTQFRRDSGWFLAEFERRGYTVEQTLAYSGGYGPMRGFLLSRQI